MKLKDKLMLKLSFFYIINGKVKQAWIRIWQNNADTQDFCCTPLLQIVILYSTKLPLRRPVYRMCPRSVSFLQIRIRDRGLDPDQRQGARSVSEIGDQIRIRDRGLDPDQRQGARSRSEIGGQIRIRERGLDPDSKKQSKFCNRFVSRLNCIFQSCNIFL